MDTNWALDETEYESPSIFELGDAGQLTLGNGGPRVDAAAEPAPSVCSG
jgi:hypothetical protein